ncbi:MAG: PQQ-binding-like beta-propeller repeat protein [Pirellulaceae bacterium]|nr:PQQ-binding-like beta-propeller repeat protein [Pirellulaceae bacterium]
MAEFPKLSQGDWPWWRGPQRDGVVRMTETVAQKWSATENVLWTADVPGRGNGSPIVVGKLVVLATCDETSGSQSLLAYDRSSGKLLWNKVVHADGAMRKNARSTGASSTPACDGQQLYINFANHDAVYTTALTLDGQQVWQTKVTNYQIHQGYGSSPGLYGDLVLVSADTKGGGTIAALKRTDGQVVWKRDRPSAPNYPSPIVLKIAGRDQLIMTGCDLVTSLDPTTGNTNWEIEGATTECVTSTVTDGMHIYTSGGYPKNHMSAVRADGSKKIAWENKERLYVPSLVIKEGYLYGVLDAGIAMCWEAATGKEMWKERLGGNFSASPVLVGDVLYATNESGETFVLRVNPRECERLSKNKLGDEAFATPTFSRGQIFMRVAYQKDSVRSEQLVCIGK